MLYDFTFEDLPRDVREELEDERFINLAHHSRATYALGCHGPLCRKAERIRGRRRTENRAKADGRRYKPFMDLRLDDRDELLDRINAWHRALRERKAS